MEREGNVGCRNDRRTRAALQRRRRQDRDRRGGEVVGLSIRAAGKWNNYCAGGALALEKLKLVAVIILRSSPYGTQKPRTTVPSCKIIRQSAGINQTNRHGYIFA